MGRVDKEGREKGFTVIGTKISSNMIFCFYLIIGSILCHLLSLTEFIKAVIALPSLLLTPYIFGFVITNPLNDIVRKSYDSLSFYTIRYLIGFLSLWILTMTLQFLHLHVILKNLPYIVLVGITLHVFFLSLYKRTGIQAFSEDAWLFKLVKRNWLIILTIMIFVIIAFLISKIRLPFPYLGENWVDSRAIYTPVIRAVKDGFLFDRRTAFLTPLFFSAKIFNVDTLSLMWTGTLLNLTIYSFSLYLFSYILFRNKLISLLVVHYGLYILSYNGKVLGNIFVNIPAYALNPNSFLFSFYPLMLFLTCRQVVKQTSDGKPSTDNNIITSNHAVILSIIIGLLLISILFTVSNLQKIISISYLTQEMIIVSTSAILLLSSIILLLLLKVKRTVQTSSFMKRLWVLLLIIFPFFLGIH